MGKILDIAYYVLIIAVVIIIAVIYRKWIKQEHENAVLRKQRIEEEMQQNKLLFEAQMLITKDVREGKIKVVADKTPCGCKEKKETTTKKKKAKA